MSSFSASRFFTPPPLPCPSVRSNDWGIWSSSSVPPGSPTPGSSLDVFLGRFPLYLPGEALGDRVAFPPSPRSSSSAGPALLGVPSSVPVEGVFSPPLCALPPLLNPSSPPPGSGMGMGGWGLRSASPQAPSASPRPAPARSSGNFSLSASLECVPTVVSYNVRGLSFYAAAGEAEDRRLRVSEAVRDLVRTADIVCLQETKLAPTERLVFSSLPGCAVSFSNLSKASSGTLIIDCPGIRRFYQGAPVPLPAVTRGRVQLRRYTPLSPNRSPFQLFNFYLVSGGEFSANSGIINSLLDLDASIPTFVCGDLNFIEKTSDSTSATPVLPTQTFLDSWEAFRTRFGLVDVDHDAHTFFHISPSDPSSRYSWSSRLDRFLAPASICSHPLFSPAVDIPHHSTNHSIRHSRSSFSDHLPVRLSFRDSSDRAPGRPTIPTWLAESPAFVESLRKSWAPCSAGSPFVSLTRYKCALFAAAREARRVKISTPSTHLQLSQHLALLRLVVSTDQDGDRVSALLVLNPSLESLVLLDGSRWVPNGLLEATRDLADFCRSAPPSSGPQKLNRVKALAEMIPSSRAQISSLRVYPDDPPSSSPLDMAKLTLVSSSSPPWKRSRLP